MRRPHALAFLLGLLGVGAAAPVACANGDEVNPGFSQDSGAGGSGAAGGTSGTGTSASVSHASSAASTGASTSASTSASASSSSSASSGSTGGGPACNDYTEPDSDEATAFDLGAFDDCDGSGSTIPGVLGTTTDADWYIFDGTDTFGCLVDATAEVTAQTAYQVCIFVECKSGNPGFTCPGGTIPLNSPDGRSGCCGNAGFSVEDLCSGSDDSAIIYIKIENKGQDECVPYDLAYHF